MLVNKKITLQTSTANGVMVLNVSSVKQNDVLSSKDTIL